MTSRTKGPFRADHVGSFLRPPSLLEARARREKGEISAAELRALEDDAIRDIVQQQEDLGLKAVTDGEYRRAFYHLDFLRRFDNVEVVQASVKARFHTKGGDIEFNPIASRVTGKLTRSNPIFVDDFRFLKSVARQTPKITLPSPSSMHFRGGRSAVDQKTYPEMETFYADLARGFAEEIRDLGAAGCTYLQLDEVNLAYLCDPQLRAQTARAGEDPEKLPATYARLINDSLIGRPAEMSVCLHLCRGNFRSGWVAEGGYEPIAELLFNGVGVDGYFLEYDTERAGNFAPLRFLPKGKVAVLGLISSKEPALENKDDIKRRIDEASQYAPLDQLALSPQCGFASTAEGNRLTPEQQFAKVRFVVDLAREIWGE